MLTEVEATDHRPVRGLTGRLRPRCGRTPDGRRAVRFGGDLIARQPDLIVMRLPYSVCGFTVTEQTPGIWRHLPIRSLHRCDGGIATRVAIDEVTEWLEHTAASLGWTEPATDVGFTPLLNDPTTHRRLAAEPISVDPATHNDFATLLDLHHQDVLGTRRLRRRREALIPAAVYEAADLDPVRDTAHPATTDTAVTLHGRTVGYLLTANPYLQQNHRWIDTPIITPAVHTTFF